MMASGILVAGNVGIDEIWRLDRALRPGRRMRCVERVLRMGGGAANTAAALLGLGHPPRIAARLFDDDLGGSLVAHLEEAGLDTSGIERVPGMTSPGTILLEPDGERTLIGGAIHRFLLPRAVSAGSDVVYLNFSSLEHPAALAQLHESRWVVAQMPLDLDEPRAAHVLIASRSDVDAMPAEALWAHRRAIDGAVLRHVILTCGKDGVACVSDDGVEWRPSPEKLTGDSIGAGDFFAAGLMAGLFDGASVADAVRQGQDAARRFLVDRPSMLRVIGEVQLRGHRA